jgi:hypothetical protein
MSDVIKGINDKLENGWTVDKYTLQWGNGSEYHTLTIKNGSLSETLQATTREQVERWAIGYARETKGKPEPLSSPDFSKVTRMVKEHIEEIAQDGFANDDYEGWIYEAVVVAIYGGGVFDWINKVAK